ncbi:MAG: hypothetical protein U5K77_04180 [Candidatus Saccharibacteria bacterium]|nr:hypothetical protein [Candidatus Saccharibacteria bacterium]
MDSKIQDKESFREAYWSYANSHVERFNKHSERNDILRKPFMVGRFIVGVSSSLFHASWQTISDSFQEAEPETQHVSEDEEISDV